VKGNKLQGRVWLFEKVDMEFKDKEREREKKYGHQRPTKINFKKDLSSPEKINFKRLS